MPWLRLDDSMGEHRKTRRLLRARGLDAFGLHAHALLHSARYLLDGRIDREYVEETLDLAGVRGKHRESVVSALVKNGQWEPVEGGWLLHDYFDYNPSKADVLESRRRDAERKARGRKQESEGSPAGHNRESERPRARGRGVGVGTTPLASRPELVEEDARAQISDDRVTETVAILKTCPRLTFDLELMGVANALLAYPNVDHRQAAHTTVTNASDPGYRTTDAGRALRYALVELDKHTPEAAARPHPVDVADAELAQLAERLRRQERAA